ncbi:MAG: M23 family metallopeptidase [Thermodesulfobacteriota bacterium]
MKALPKLLLIVIGVALVGGGVFGFFRMEGAPPQAEIRSMPEALGEPKEVVFDVSDSDSGLRRVRITLTAQGEEKVLTEREFPAKHVFGGGETRQETVSATIDPKALGLSDGEAVLRLTARDYAWRGWWRGNAATLEKTIQIDTRPPRISVLTQQHNINQGGAGLVIYEVSEPGAATGVRVGEDFYPGYPAETVLGRRPTPTFLAYFALNFRQGRGTPMHVEASDPAGNVSRAGFAHYIRPKTFPTDDLRISDGFLQRKLPEFHDDLEDLDEPVPADPVERFLVVNRALRQLDGEKLRAVAQTSDSRKHWSGAFLRLANSAQRAGFADHRNYFYNGDVIDEQFHMGIDLASVAQAPVAAANSGRVALAEDVGIYGGTIMIDHGMGIFSLYSHLSRIQAEPGQMVEKGDVIGNTGATGMAGGDHLHFGMMIHSTFVTPVEWWDSHWIEDNILRKIKAFSPRS